MKLCVVGGGGYVGLITSVGFALLGHRVTGVDIDGPKVAGLQRGRCPIREEGVEDALRQCLASGCLRFATSALETVRDADLVFVTVGSPAGSDGGTDLSQWRQVAEQLAQAVDHYAVVAIKSTLPLDSIPIFQAALSNSHQPGQELDLVINPEFLREGRGLHDFFHPTRIVVGTESERARRLMRELYAPFTGAGGAETSGIAMAHHVPLLETTMVDALMIKYAANSFLATRISFVNEVATICERVGASITEVVKGLGYDPRIGPDYLQAGIGFGGPCLEKDVQALIHMSREHAYEPHLLQAVLDRNHQQVQDVLDRLQGALGEDLAGKRIAVFGLAFKPRTNDVRMSLSLRLMELLLQKGARVWGHDPVAIPEARRALPQASYCDDPYEAVQGADALLLLTGWPDYQRLSYGRIAAIMKSPTVLDGRNSLDPEDMRRLGFRYLSIGRKP